MYLPIKTVNSLFKTIVLINFLDLGIIIIFLITLICITKFDIFKLNLILTVILTIMIAIRIGLMSMLISFYIEE